MSATKQIQPVSAMARPSSQTLRLYDDSLTGAWRESQMMADQLLLDRLERLVRIMDGSDQAPTRNGMRVELGTRPTATVADVAESEIAEIVDELKADHPRWQFAVEPGQPLHGQLDGHYAPRQAAYVEYRRQQDELRDLRAAARAETALLDARRNYEIDAGAWGWETQEPPAAA